MKKDNPDTINKSLLLNFLSSGDEDIPLEELSKWITVKTDGKYALIKNSNTNPLSSSDKIKHE